MTLERFYFVCGQCEAKWFADRSDVCCPRCGRDATSTERLVPPWQPVPIRNDASDCASKPVTSTLLMTFKQLAFELQLSKRALYRLRSQGDLPSPLRLGRSWRWRTKDIEGWVAAGCPSGATQPANAMKPCSD